MWSSSSEEACVGRGARGALRWTEEEPEEEPEEEEEEEAMEIASMEGMLVRR